MRNWLFVGFAFITISLYQNCSATHENIEGASLTSSGGGTTIDDVDMAKSLVAFERTLFPITQDPANCVRCHGVGQQPLHSVSDVNISHDVMISFGLVNLRDPANSIIVQKLAGGHQGFDATVQTQILDAIQDWSDELVANGGIIGVGAGIQPTYSSLFTEFLDTKCTTCHSPGQPGEVYDYTDYVNTINTGGVIPLNAGASIITNYNGTNHEPSGNAPTMTPEERAALVLWINRGALNN